MGRPKADNPKIHHVKCRLDEAEYNQLMEYCKQSGMSITEVVRKGIYLVCGIQK